MMYCDFIIASNDKKVIEAFDSNDMSKNIVDLNVEKDILTQSSLGLLWDLQTDTIRKIAQTFLEKWKNNLPDLENLRIPRVIVPSLFEALRKELLVFCDASELAIAAVCYLRHSIQMVFHLKDLF